MFGAYYKDSRTCQFTVWAPKAESATIHIVNPRAYDIPLEKKIKGYWQGTADNIKPGSHYFIRLNGTTDRPDPCSNFQPDGVHGPSEVVDHNSFSWTDDHWKGISLEKMIMYELHVGTFTQEGTFEAIINRLDDLLDLGINAIELMPIAQFPGERNWGYDGVHPFAPQNSYGRPEQLKHLVDTCHQKNIAVVLDVVYNHLGPEGNYLSEFGYYFTGKYHTPWGDAINFDEAHSDEVRNYFIGNALFWMRQYHIDALRLDALHAVFDMSAKPFLRELAEKVDTFSKEAGRSHYLIGESDLNDVKLIQSREDGGYGLDAQWCDDFHHSVHTLVTGEENGYYADFGRIQDLEKSLNEGYVYSWLYSKHRKRHHGNSSKDIPADKFVVFSQNHDQVGNRLLGERLSALVSFDALKLAAGALIFSPYIPLLFMGQEYAEDSPFLYFVSHTDPDLVSAVREGRSREFKVFGWKGDVPDPQAENTFLESKLKWENRNTNQHKVLLKFYKSLLQMRKSIPALSNLSKRHLTTSIVHNKNVLLLHRWNNKSQVISFLNYENENCEYSEELPKGTWIKIIDSAEEKWNGSGSTLPKTLNNANVIKLPAHSFAAYQMENHTEEEGR